MKKYTVKFKFHTARVGGRGSVIGNSGSGEIDITVDGHLEIETKKASPGFALSIKNYLQTEDKFKKMGKIISLEILDIISESNMPLITPPTQKPKSRQVHSATTTKAC